MDPFQIHTWSQSFVRSAISHVHFDLQSLLCLPSSGFTKDDLELLPLGYKLPIKELLHHFISVNDVSISVETAAFLGRTDIVAMRKEKRVDVERQSTLGKEENEDKDGMSFNPEVRCCFFNLGYLRYGQADDPFALVCTIG